MERFDDSHDNHYISQVAELVTDLATSIPQMLERITLLQAAVNEIAKRDLDDSDVPDESHGYIPLDLGDFFASLIALEKVLTVDVDYRHQELRHRPCSFLEIGCGPGRNVHLLRCTDRFNFDSVQGLDISEAMISTGRTRYGLGADLFVEDCMTFDYSGYDVVFFYRPLNDEDAENAFEARLVETLKPGALIVGVGATSLEEHRKVIVKDEDASIFKVL